MAISKTAPTSFIRPSPTRTFASGVSMIWCIVHRTFASTARASRSSSPTLWSTGGKPGDDRIHQDLDPRALAAPVELPIERRLDRSALLVTQNDKERRIEDRACELEASHHLGGKDVPRHAHDEQLAEPRVEDQLDGYARVAAAQDRGEGSLAVLERRERIFPRGGEVRLVRGETARCLPSAV